MDTLNGIYQNVEVFGQFEICNEDIGVIIIFDGCLKIDPSISRMFEKEDQFKNAA